jgi:uncharacterized protein
MTVTTSLDTPEINAALFVPAQVGTVDPGKAGASVVLPVAEGVFLHCCWYPVDPLAPLLFYFHDGRGPAAAALAAMAGVYNRHGLGVFLATYRGFGASDGQPGVGYLCPDAEALFDQGLAWLRQHGWQGPVFLMGNSLGSVCAIATAHARAEAVKGLIVESSLGDTLSYLRSLGVAVDELGLGPADVFNTHAVIQQIELPTLIFHGARDSRVSPGEAERLQAASGARNKQFFLIPGADRDSLATAAGELYYQTVRKFIDGVCGINTWRQKRKSFKSGQSGEN